MILDGCVNVMDNRLPIICIRLNFVESLLRLTPKQSEDRLQAGKMLESGLGCSSFEYYSRPHIWHTQHVSKRAGICSRRASEGLNFRSR